MEKQLIQLCPNKQMNREAWKEISKPPAAKVRSFHQQLEEYEVTPLIHLEELADELSLDSIWVKDEAHRFGLKAYKALGGSFAIARFLQERYNLKELTFEGLHASNFSDAEELTFATMTDGNHGLGVAYIASKLGYKSEIYVPKEMVPARIEAIEKAGAKVTIFEGGYDDAARQIAIDAEKYGWQVISDTAWEGYEKIPAWIMDGYTTLFEETMEQLSGAIPTHVFIQAGVGSLAASLIQYFRSFYRNEDIRIIITEPEKANCFYCSAMINDGKAHAYPGKVNTIMAGLACAEPNPIAWPVIRDGADFMLSCSDEISKRGMRNYHDPLRDDEQIISGEAGAVTLGALHQVCSDPDYSDFRSLLSLNAGSRVLLVNTEGNTDPVNFKKIVAAD